MASTRLLATASAEAWDATAPAFNQIGRVFDCKGMSHPGAIGLFDTVAGNGPFPENTRILDVAGGTGAVALYAAEKIKDKNGTVLATDFSPAMVSVIKGNIEGLKLTNVKAEVMDGQNLTVDDSSFDYVFSCWGLIFFPDVDKGFSEMYRVTKPGGKSGITTWTTENANFQVAQEIGKRIGLFNIASHEGWINSMKSNPGFVDTREILGIDEETCAKHYVEILAEKYPELPAKITQTTLIVYGTK